LIKPATLEENVNTKPHIIYAEDEYGNLKDEFLAFVHPADPNVVQAVLRAPEKTNDGRSEFVWVRLANGDLVLGVFPRGDTYIQVEQDAAYPA
jgi:hypothetical protein